MARRKAKGNDFVSGFVAIACVIGVSRIPPVETVGTYPLILLKTIVLWGASALALYLVVRWVLMRIKAHPMVSKPFDEPWSQPLHNRQEPKVTDKTWQDTDQAKQHFKPSALPAAWSLALLKDLAWQRLEQLSYEILGINYRAELTGTGADGGVDIRLYAKNDPIPTKPLALVQVKSRSNRKVGVAIVRELKGVMAVEGVPTGVLVGTLGFTEDAIAFAKESRIQLIDGNRLLNLIEQLPVDKKMALLKEITKGEYSRPDCPSCGIALVQRTAKQGANKGRQFWGCCNFPRCKVIIN